MQDDVVDILLVDDEPRNLDALEAILGDPGYSLLRAGDADTALRLLLDHSVAAIILDIKMPGVSGFELAQIIKGTKKYREIPIVFLTAYLGDDQAVLAGYGAGAVDYLTKPISPQILKHKVAVFADLFRKTRALAELNAHLEARVQERTADLERSEAAIQAASKQKDAFLATLAHELRNPLAPLRTGLDLLLRMPEPGTDVQRTLAAMNRQLDHMVRLVDDLLDVSRVSRGMLELKRARVVDLTSVIETAIETAGPFMRRRQLSLTLEAKAQVSAFVDATRIAQVVGNLLHNASKYAPQGGEVRVEMSREDGNVIVRVIDRGAGIPPDQIAHVFDMFTKIERSVANANTGLGIGLALSRRLAELHGGTLTAESEGEGKGATFTLSLPVDTKPATTNDPEHATPDARAASTASLSVVVIEDNEDSAELLAMWLERMGHTARVAHNGHDGLALVREARPDVVLCDIGLPDMDGIEVRRRVKAEMASQPVMIALTGWGTEADRKRTSDVGFDHHLVKPVELEKLREMLEKIASTRSP
jgi:signal transduction histidine kinase